MKPLLLFFFCIFFFPSSMSAQENEIGVSRSSFIEWNFGIARIPEIENFPMPGTSVLWGRTTIYPNNFIFEYEGGFAFPTVITGKVGIGKKFNDTNITFGVRPFPFHLYAQSSFPAGKKGYWIGSVEFNPLNSTNSLFGSKAILNFGYRWNLTMRK